MNYEQLIEKTIKGHPLCENAVIINETMMKDGPMYIDNEIIN
ncbi:hypothetical protein [Oceanivirga salmonicida]|nr:hypothetical protein [Oceanivirga salmonicida]